MSLVSRSSAALQPASVVPLFVVRCPALLASVPEVGSAVCVVLLRSRAFVGLRLLRE